MPAAVPSVTTARIISLRSASVAAGSGLAVTCLVPAVRIGCLNEPFSTVAATEAIASGDAVSSPSPHVSWASSAPEAEAGTFMYDALTLPPRPRSHFWSRP